MEIENNGKSMRNFLTVSFIMIVAILAISCGQQSEQPVVETESNSFAFATFADAEKAAAESQKFIVLDFYTDW